MEYQHLLDKFVSAAKRCFSEKLTGVYLHGSLAMGCFHPDVSDIDLLVVVDGDISCNEKLLFMQEVLSLNRLAPQKGIEMSVVQRSALNPFLYPTPFLLHFSPVHTGWFERDPLDYVQNMNGLDKDLGAHCTVIRQHGIVLFGEPVNSAFGDIDDQIYLDSILYDINEARETIHEYPVSTILNLCRSYAFATEKVCLSKKEGGAWALKHLPAHLHSLAREAAQCYAAGKAMHVDLNQSLAFAEEMLERIYNTVEQTKKP